MKHRKIYLIVITLISLLFVAAEFPPDGYVIFSGTGLIYQTTWDTTYRVTLDAVTEDSVTGHLWCEVSLETWPGASFSVGMSIEHTATIAEDYLRPELECNAEDFQLIARSTTKKVLSPGPRYIDEGERVKYIANDGTGIYTVWYETIPSYCMVHIEGDSGFSYTVSHLTARVSNGTTPWFHCYPGGTSILDDVIFLDHEVALPMVANNE